MKRLFVFIIGCLSIISFIGCAIEADVASQNLSYKADNFEVKRRVVFFNGITNDFILEIIGYIGRKPQAT